MSEERTRSHVVFTDRIGLEKRWFKNILACDMTFGTVEYEKAVWCLYHSVINIKDGARLKDIIDKYINTEWRKRIDVRVEQWKKRNPSLSLDPDVVDNERHLTELELLPDLQNKICQTFEDNGFGFYHSRYDDEVQEKLI